MPISISDFQSAARLGGNISLHEKDSRPVLVNSETSWFGRAVAWVKSIFMGEKAKQAQATTSSATRSAFVDQLRSTYGDMIAREISQKFGIETSDKPLSARTVHDAL